MADYIHLIGADDVSRAGSSMRSAASDMTRAAVTIDETMRLQRMFLDDWLARLELVLRDTKGNTQGG